MPYTISYWHLCETMATSNDPASEFQNISRLVKTIQENANLSLSRQAIGDVQNIVLNGTPTVLEKLVDVGILEALCEHLTIDADESVLMEQLDALYLIMGRSTNQMAVWTKRIENCGGMYCSNELHSHIF